MYTIKINIKISNVWFKPGCVWPVSLGATPATISLRVDAVYRHTQYTCTTVNISICSIQIKAFNSQSVSKLNWRSWSTQFYMATSPDYLRQFTRLSDVPSRSSLRSASTHYILIPPVRRSTVGASSFLGQLFGAVCQLTLRLSTVCLPVFRHRLNNYCSCTRIQAPFNNCISFSIVA